MYNEMHRTCVSSILINVYTWVIIIQSRTGTFHNPRNCPCAPFELIPTSDRQPSFSFLSPYISFTVLGVYLTRIIWSGCFCVQILLLNMSVRSIQVTMCSNRTFIPIVMLYSIVRIHLWEFMSFRW